MKAIELNGTHVGRLARLEAGNAVIQAHIWGVHHEQNEADYTGGTIVRLKLNAFLPPDSVFQFDAVVSAETEVQLV